MRQICYFTLLAFIFLAMGTSAAQVPDLLGNWTAKWSSYDNGSGFTNSAENESLLISITEQKERIFAGNLTFEKDNESISSESFAGAIGLDGKTLYISEFDGGYSFGTLISGDEMELIYLQDGEDGGVAIDTVHRIEE